VTTPHAPIEEPKPTTLQRELAGAPLEPRPWTAPDFVERSTCAEIGAYAFQDA
jgi:coenzyme PQQ precursor peptide PqqA